MNQNNNIKQWRREVIAAASPRSPSGQRQVPRAAVFQLVKILEWTGRAVDEKRWSQVITTALEDATDGNDRNRNSARNFLAKILPLKPNDLAWAMSPELTLEKVKTLKSELTEELSKLVELKNRIDVATDDTTDATFTASD